ncbi:MAG TPA: hypothetical protein VL551_13110 [Actinospica sp.]|jgi:hypothetical protein|nr:hypothetical protein [Actinospica sp.]
MATQQNKKDAAQRRAELAAKQAAMARAEQRRKTAWGVSLGVLIAALIGGLIVFAIHTNNKDSAAVAQSEAANSTVGESNLLAPTWSGLKGQTIEGVGSNQMEQLAYHIHAHLAIYVNGTQKTVPYGIGIEQPWSTEADGSSEFVDSGAAFYYLHTHDDTGVIHIESPNTTIYTLGQFFAEWNQPLSATQIGPYKGTVTAFVNGSKVTGDPSAIKLNSHEVIQLDLGKVVGFQPYTFASGL